jgi:uncharacterized protein YecA (UPF0149 family)
MWSMSTFCPQIIDTANIIDTNNTYNTKVTRFRETRKTDSPNSTINTVNTVLNCPCGSGKKYKNCCGKNG